MTNNNNNNKRHITDKSYIWAANIPSDSTIEWRPIHWKLGNAGDVKPIDRMVPLQPPSLQNRGEPSPPGHRGGPSPWLPPRRPIRDYGPTPEHRVPRPRRLPGRRRPRRHPQHLLDHVWSRIVQRGRAVDGPRPDPHRPEEGCRQAPDGGRVGAVLRRLLLRRHLRGHLGLLPSLCA